LAIHGAGRARSARDVMEALTGLEMVRIFQAWMDKGERHGHRDD
jgi:hypothetical protein